MKACLPSGKALKEAPLSDAELPRFAQVVVTEEGGGVSTSEVRRVAIAQRVVGTGLLAEPHAPLPLRPHTSFLGDFVMRSYMPRVAYLCVSCHCDPPVRLCWFV